MAKRSYQKEKERRSRRWRRSIRQGATDKGPHRNSNGKRRGGSRGACTVDGYGTTGGSKGKQASSQPVLRRLTRKEKLAVEKACDRPNLRRGYHGITDTMPDSKKAGTVGREMLNQYRSQSGTPDYLGKEQIRGGKTAPRRRLALVVEEPQREPGARRSRHGWLKG